MKTIALLNSSVAILALAVVPVNADIYTDATGDFTGNTFMDITSVNVTHDASNLYFTINVAGPDLTANNWVNFLIGISTAPGGGANFNASGGWGLDLQMSTDGMDYLVGGYPYWGTGGIYSWNGSTWVSGSGPWSSETTTSATITVPLSSVGSPSTIKFDVWANSTGNNVLDALSDTTSRSWNNDPFNTGANALTYVVPEPGSLALLGLAGLLAALRRKS